MILLKFGITFKDGNLDPTTKNVPENCYYRLYQLKRKSSTNLKV